MKLSKAPSKNQFQNNHVLYKISPGNNILYRNIDQIFIETTEDKLLLKLQKYVKKQEKRLCWIAPLSILVSFILTLPTTKTKDFLGINAARWSDFYIFLFCGVLIWLISSVLYAILNNETPESFIKSLKTSTPVDPITGKPIKSISSFKSGSSKA